MSKILFWTYFENHFFKLPFFRIFFFKYFSVFYNFDVTVITINSPILPPSSTRHHHPHHHHSHHTTILITTPPPSQPNQHHHFIPIEMIFNTRKFSIKFFHHSLFSFVRISFVKFDNYFQFHSEAIWKKLTKTQHFLPLKALSPK